jgi:hypothetical protein
MTTFEKNYNYFESIRNELVKSNHGKVVLISDEKEQGFFENEIEACNAGEEKFGQKGDFIIQNCLTKEEDISYIYSIS